MHFSRLGTRGSPMLGCFSKRQILASLSSFWWSKRKIEETGTSYFYCSSLSPAMIGFLKHLTWSWLQVSSDSVKDAAQNLGVTVTVSGYLTLTLLYLSLCVCLCVRWLCVSPDLFLITTEMLGKNNVTWYVLGYEPQTDATTTTASYSGFILTPGVLLTLLLLKCFCRFLQCAKINEQECQCNLNSHV